MIYNRILRIRQKEGKIYRGNDVIVTNQIYKKNNAK